MTPDEMTRPATEAETFRAALTGASQREAMAENAFAYARFWSRRSRGPCARRGWRSGRIWKNRCVVRSVSAYRH